MTYDTQDNAEKMRLENKYRASQNLRASLDYDAFATGARDARDDGAGLFGGHDDISPSRMAPEAIPDRRARGGLEEAMVLPARRSIVSGGTTLSPRETPRTQPRA